MKNPYDVLGIPSTATIDEVKDAYRNMAKKYHPDNYTNSPLQEQASRKMQEINEAYDNIILMRGSAGQQSSNQSYRSTDSTGYNAPGSTDFYDIRIKINQGRIDDAEMLLDGIPSSKRNAEWHFLKGSIQNRRGWFEEARNSFSNATRMDPSNVEYANAFNNLNRSGNGAFRANRRSYNDKKGCSTCDICTGLLCADCCCECLGGDLISCC